MAHLEPIFLSKHLFQLTSFDIMRALAVGDLRNYAERKRVDLIELKLSQHHKLFTEIINKMTQERGSNLSFVILTGLNV